MIIIGFATNTSKILPRILCRHFRHAAPIAPTKNPKKPFIMYQYIKRRQIAKIELSPRDIKLLQNRGWRFVYIPRDLPHGFNPMHAHSCVDLSKRAIGLDAPFIMRPDALYKYLCQK